MTRPCYQYVAGRMVACEWLWTGGNGQRRFDLNSAMAPGKGHSLRPGEGPRNRKRGSRAPAVAGVATVSTASADVLRRLRRPVRGSGARPSARNRRPGPTTHCSQEKPGGRRPFIRRGRLDQPSLRSRCTAIRSAAALAATQGGGSTPQVALLSASIAWTGRHGSGAAAAAAAAMIRLSVPGGAASRAAARHHAA